MKKILTVCVCFLLIYCSAYSDGEIKPIMSIDYNGLLSSNQLLRYNFSSDIETIEFNYFSIASQYDGNKVRVSSNFMGFVLFVGSQYLLRKRLEPLGKNTNILINLPFMIHTLSNPSFKFSLFSHSNNRSDSSLYGSYYRYSHQDMGIFLSLNVKTDYFLFYEIPRIYSEGKIGLNMQYYNFAIDTHLGIPFTKGYFENKAPYFGISALYYFDRYYPK